MGKIKELNQEVIENMDMETHNFKTAPKELFEHKTINSALWEVHQNFGIILKEGSTGKYQFRKVDDIIDRLHYLLNKANIIIKPTILSGNLIVKDKGNEKFYSFYEVRVEYKFIYLPDSSFVTAIGIGLGLDFTGDKCIGKAMSNCYKYVMNQMFSIPLNEEEGDSTDFDNLPVSPKLKPLRKNVKISRKQAVTIRGLMHPIKDVYPEKEIFKKWNANPGYKTALKGGIIKKVEDIPEILGNEIIQKLTAIVSNEKAKKEKKNEI